HELRSHSAVAPSGGILAAARYPGRRWARATRPAASRETALMALRLHAITPNESAHPHVVRDGARAIVFRELAAVVTDREKFALDEVDPRLADEHREIVDAVFKNQVVLPTPAGIVFR